jgi:hypothetical protein
MKSFFMTAFFMKAVVEKPELLARRLPLSFPVSCPAVNDGWFVSLLIYLHTKLPDRNKTTKQA